MHASWLPLIHAYKLCAEVITLEYECNIDIGKQWMESDSHIDISSQLLLMYKHLPRPIRAHNHPKRPLQHRNISDSI